MDLEHIFDELEIATDPFALCELRGSCDLGLGRDPQATLHYILSGQGEITLKGRAPVQVAEGSLVLIPAMHSHALRSFGYTTEPLPDCKPAALNLARLLKQSDRESGAQLTALCSHVQVGLRGLADIIDLIREPLIECVSDHSKMRPALSAMIQELAHPGLGSRAMIRTLLTQCMIEMLRTRLSVRDSALHWMAALTDPSIWNALSKMIDEPGAPHSIESLAESVGMSRSAFAKRFANAYGSGPMELLRDLRMRQASRLLATTDLPVKRIASLMGFASRSAFTRRFEAITGQSPSGFRASVATLPS